MNCKAIEIEVVDKRAELADEVFKLVDEANSNFPEQHFTDLKDRILLFRVRLKSLESELVDFVQTLTDEEYVKHEAELRKQSLVYFCTLNSTENLLLTLNVIERLVNRSIFKR